MTVARALSPRVCVWRSQGDFQHGKRHGYGVYTYADGGRFEGEWVDDKVHGRGVSVYSSGNRYEGEWVDGRINGQGTLWYADGDQYQGEWRDGKMHGRGTYTYADGDLYEGDWKDDRRHGKGTVTYAAIEGGAAEKYEGDWSDGKMHGYVKYFTVWHWLYRVVHSFPTLRPKSATPALSPPGPGAIPPRFDPRSHFQKNPNRRSNASAARERTTLELSS